MDGREARRLGTSPITSRSVEVASQGDVVGTTGRTGAPTDPTVTVSVPSVTVTTPSVVSTTLSTVSRGPLSLPGSSVSDWVPTGGGTTEGGQRG